ncbi:hypothetical protein ScPMuIL_002562 [Solemya velum]
MGKYTGPCKAADVAKGLCFGGIARRMAKIKEIRNKFPNHLLLDAGDQYQGSLWFIEYKGLAASYFMNLLGYDAMTLGNHEFDKGVDTLVPFFDNITFPVVTSNIDVTNEPRLQDRFNKSVVVEVGGERIGIVGYTTKTTPSISSPGPGVRFQDEIQSVRTEVQKLQAEGISIIIVLGHGGYKLDKKMAHDVEGIDVIVGGHSHTFLYTGDPPSIEKPDGEYPTIIEQANNTTVPDPDIIEELKDWKRPLQSLKQKVVGKTAVHLEGTNKECRLQECNLGNLVADSIVSYFAERNSAEDVWTEASVSLVNSGGIRAPIEKGNVTMEDVLTVMPFGNYIDVITIRGNVLMEVLSHSIESRDTLQPDGAFLQFSGIRVRYDTARQSGERVVDVSVRCQNCLVPRYEPIDRKALYKIAVSDFVISGGDGYDMLKNNENRSRFSGSPPHKPLSPLAEAVQSVLGEDSEVISDLEGGIDSSLISLLQPQDDVWRRFSCLSALATGRPPYEDT